MISNVACPNSKLQLLVFLALDGLGGSSTPRIRSLSLSFFLDLYLFIHIFCMLSYIYIIFIFIVDLFTSYLSIF